MNMHFFYAAIALMLIIICKEFIKNRYGFDSDKFDIGAFFHRFKPINKSMVIKRTSGKNNLIMVDAGENKATVTATLRQITGIDYRTAKQIVDTVPSQFLANISDKEADLTKKALEFVGAKIEIR